MGLFNVFKKKNTGTGKENLPPSKPAPTSDFGRTHDIIVALWGDETYKNAVTTFKEVINNIVVEDNIRRKTELLDGGLDMCLELLEQAKRNPQTKLGANSITAFIYYRIFLECVLAIDTEILEFTEFYTIFQIGKYMPPELHPYIQMIIKIMDLLDRGIVYLYENMDSVTEDYFLPVEKRIRKMLNAYTDDNTGWNKINPQA